MNKGDKDARVLQDATGARYTTCLARVRSLRALASLPEGKALDAFMYRVKGLPDLIGGQARCATCLHDLAPTRGCTCL
jgi:hypothetical protein